jgi:hypothetical protein
MDEIDRIEKDINGLGERVNKMDVVTGQLEVKACRNEGDIKSLWGEIAEIKNLIRAIDDKISGVVVKVATISGIFTVAGVILMAFLYYFLGTRGVK